MISRINRFGTAAQKYPHICWFDKTYFNYKTTSVLHNYYNPAIVYYNICNLIKLIFESQRVMTKR